MCFSSSSQLLSDSASDTVAQLLPLSHPGFAALDLETTSLSAQDGRIVEIGVVTLTPHMRVEETWTRLVNPGPGHSVGPTHIHGITESDVSHAPTFPELASELESLLAGRILIAHNSRFDTSFLQAAFGTVGVWPWPGQERIPALCTLTTARHFMSTPSRALTACCAAAGITLTHHHRALHDAFATAQLAATYFTRAASGESLPRQSECDAGAPLPATAICRTREDLLPRLPAPWVDTFSTQT